MNTENISRIIIVRLHYGLLSASIFSYSRICMRVGKSQVPTLREYILLQSEYREFGTRDGRTTITRPKQYT
jgi:hypothetical protein